MFSKLPIIWKQLPNLPPMPLGPPAKHGQRMWLGDVQYEYIDQDVRKAEDKINKQVRVYLSTWIRARAAICR